MKKHYPLLSMLFAIAALLTSLPPAVGQESAPAGPSVNLVATVEARHGTNVPVITRDDVMVYQGRDRDKVTDWLPLQGDHAGLELFILLDDSSNVSLGSQLEDIRQFILAQPASTKIGIAYMQNGIAQVMQNLNSDHTLAAKALRLPLGSPGANASPYFSLGDLIKRWPENPERREVIMITDGIDRYWGSGPDNAYVDTVIEQASSALGSSFIRIYTPGRRTLLDYSLLAHLTGDSSIIFRKLADETGGESYYLHRLRSAGFIHALSFGRDPQAG